MGSAAVASRDLRTLGRWRFAFALDPYFAALAFLPVAFSLDVRGGSYAG